MLVFLQAKLVFFATPKTGSTAIEHGFSPFADMIFQGNPEIKHIPPRRFNRLIAPFVSKYTGDDLCKVALMREPLDWLGSWYRYRRRDALLGHPNSTATVSFNQFIEAYLAETRPAFADLGSQHKFLRLRDDSVGVDRLFRYENMSAVSKFLCERLNQSVALEHLNVSPTASLTLSPTLKRELEQRQKADFDLYHSATV